MTDIVNKLIIFVPENQEYFNSLRADDVRKRRNHLAALKAAATLSPCPTRTPPAPETRSTRHAKHATPQKFNIYIYENKFSTQTTSLTSVLSDNATRQGRRRETIQFSHVVAPKIDPREWR